MLVCHLEEVDLRYRAGDVEDRIDAAEVLQCLLDRRLRRRRPAQVEIHDQRLRAIGFDLFGCLGEALQVAGDEHNRGETLRKPQRGSLTDALARACDDSHGLDHGISPFP